MIPFEERSNLVKFGIKAIFCTAFSVNRLLSSMSVLIFRQFASPLGSSTRPFLDKFTVRRLGIPPCMKVRVRFRVGVRVRVRT